VTQLSDSTLPTSPDFLANAARLTEPVQYLPGVGPQLASLLARLGLNSPLDVLMSSPRDVIDLTHVADVTALRENELQSVCGSVVERDSRLAGNGRRICAVLLDCGTGFVRAVWFNQPWVFQRFQPGLRVLMTGKPRFKSRRWEFAHPSVQFLDVDDPVPGGTCLPRYRLTEGLRAEEMRRVARRAVDEFADAVPEILPQSLRSEWKLPSIGEALRLLHTPRSSTDFELGRSRLIFDDLLEFQLGVQLRRRAWRATPDAPPIEVSTKVDARIRRLFPFTLTEGQERAIRDIVADLKSGVPMHRLLQADVGAGKTTVAVYAMLAAVAAGFQAVLMSPTELLTQQHAASIDRMLHASRVTRCVLSGQLTSAERHDAISRIARGEIQLIIGTQSLIQDDVRFANLGVLVIDEQHKFGVSQRSRFQEQGRRPHTLVMTATPIPRSLSLTQFGDLDLSVMTDLPPGRQPVVTVRVSSAPTARKMWTFIRGKLLSGRQAYVVCPRIGDGRGDSEEMGTFDLDATDDDRPDGDRPDGDRSDGDRPDGDRLHGVQPRITAGLDDGVFSTHQQLVSGELNGFRCAMLHGRMSSDEKGRIMDAFRRGEIQVLISTTVIEVGVDVPNATLLMIRSAERFGLSQLHQLRGRVGRGSFQGYCFVCTRSTESTALERLEAFEKTSSGFDVAEADFRLRGPGDVLGDRQHGALPLRIADLVRDAEAVERTRAAAIDLIQSNRLDSPEYAALKIRVLDRFGKLFDLTGGG
jgi:ATP-dependent DNA helicase RecG